MKKTSVKQIENQPTFSLSQASREAGIDRETLAKRLVAAKIETHAGRRYTLGEILRAMSTRQEFDAAKLEEQKYRAFQARLAFETAGGKWLLKDHVEKRLLDMFVTARRDIERSKLPMSVKQQVIKILLATKLPPWDE